MVQLAQLALQRQEDDLYHAMEVDNAQAQVDPELPSPPTHTLLQLASQAVGRQLVHQAEALLPPVPLITPAEQAMMVGGQEQAPQQEQQQAQAQVDPAPQAPQQEQQQAPMQLFAGERLAQRMAARELDVGRVVQDLLQEAELRREQRQERFPLGQAQGEEFMRELQRQWQQHRRRQEQHNEQPQAQAQEQPQEQPQEMAPMVLAPQVGPLYNQEQHALAAQAEEERVAQAQEHALNPEEHEQMRRHALRETVGGTKILLGELSTPDGHPMPYERQLTNLKVMFSETKSELVIMHALLDADGVLDTAVAMLAD